MKIFKAGTSRKRGVAGAVVVLLAALGQAPSIHAQVLYGSIVGNVKDATGAAVPGAAVTATHHETKATRATVTDGTGAYRFSTVQPGTSRWSWR